MIVCLTPKCKNLISEVEGAHERDTVYPSDIQDLYCDSCRIKKEQREYEDNEIRYGRHRS